VYGVGVGRRSRLEKNAKNFWKTEISLLESQGILFHQVSGNPVERTVSRKPIQLAKRFLKDSFLRMQPSLSDFEGRLLEKRVSLNLCSIIVP
jgi:hypothetical protein